ncbi:hypothetical protein Patl1_04504 [Pistacia atlantica]|uniref:Uncharacterized protein n=1 Tax=Pistacia atlantica TaxID=434234 RepID=A0ACC1BUT9_9ROSI|nr:hypothetical protein Patl1_04504 [Pistacia atlantica]
MNLKECKAACTKNCSCRAYANSELTGGGIGCLMWFKDLTDMRECSKQYSWGQDIFIRVPASELGLDEKKRQETIIVLSIFSGLFILVLIIIITLKKAKKKGEESSKVDSEVPLLELSIIVTATNNFSEENLIGAGGFGPVYKVTLFIFFLAVSRKLSVLSGSYYQKLQVLKMENVIIFYNDMQGNLPTGEEVAVKRLSENSVQGTEQFRNEAILIAKLQHKNLVALLGSCIQGEERLLIYEYMPNKSLDYFIYGLYRFTL